MNKAYIFKIDQAKYSLIKILEKITNNYNSIVTLYVNIFHYASNTIDFIFYMIMIFLNT
jgi:hypothetical protein